MKVQLLLALQYLNGRKLRSFLTTLAVMFGVLVIFGMNILLPSMLQSFQSTMLAASNNVDLTVAQISGESFPTAVLNDLRGIDGVLIAQGMLSRTVNLPADFFDGDPARADTVTTLSLVGLDLETAQAMHNYNPQSGRFLQPADTTSAVISQSLADNLGLQTGDVLPLPTTQGVVDLTITGILPPRAVPGNEEVLVTLPEAQRLLGAAGKINVMEVNLTTLDEAQRLEIQNQIESLLGPGYQFGALSSGTDLFATLQLAQSLFNAFGFLALFMGGFIIFNTFRTLVAERRRDIGMLRAVGASRRMITGLILIEGLIQGTVGTLIGMALGYAFGALALSAASGVMQRFIHIQLGGPVVTPTVVILSVAAGVGITLLAGLLPALSAGRVQPVEALRPAVAAVESRRAVGLSALLGILLIAAAAVMLVTGQSALISAGAFAFLIGLALLAPVLVRPVTALFANLIALRMARQGTGLLAQGNLTRQPTRAAVTASTSMIALAILVVVGGLTASVSRSFVNALEVSLGSDYLFVPPSIAVWNTNVGAGSEMVEQLKAIPGVGPVSTLRFANAIADVQPAMPAKGQARSEAGLSVSVLGIDPAAYPEVSGLDFIKGSGGEAYPAIAGERAMIANGIFASTAGLKVGDSVPLMTPLNGVQNYRVAAVGGDYMNVKIMTAYISQSNLAADFGKSEDVFIQLNLAPGADAAAVEQQLTAVKQQYPQFTMIAGRLYLQQTIELFRSAFAGLHVLFIFLTIPSLIAMLNTLAIGVIERTREIGMIRAVGATQKQIRQMILAEALLLAGIGTLFGLLAGLYLDYAMMGAFEMIGFPAMFIFPWNGLVLALLVGLTFGALASLLPARRAAQLEIVQALRYE